MSSNEHDALRALGLTDYGARAYAALVGLGPSPAATVASAGPVPRTKVYAVLSDLAKRGWVEVVQGRPRSYRPVRPRECFDRERARIEGLLAAALPPLEAKHADRSTRFAGPLWVVAGEETMAERTLAMVDHARQDVLLIAPFPIPGDRSTLPKAMRTALKRGVRVRVAVADPDSAHAKAFAAAGAELRVALVPPRILLVDGRQALTTFPVPREGGGVDYKGIWAPSPELAEVAGGMLGALWAAAEPVGKGSL